MHLRVKILFRPLDDEDYTVELLQEDLTSELYELEVYEADVDFFPWEVENEEDGEMMQFDIVSDSPEDIMQWIENVVKNSEYKDVPYGLQIYEIIETINLLEAKPWKSL